MTPYRYRSVIPVITMGVADFDATMTPVRPQDCLFTPVLLGGVSNSGPRPPRLAAAEAVASRAVHGPEI